MLDCLAGPCYASRLGMDERELVLRCLVASVECGFLNARR